jgi:hypothetical protein
MRAAAAAPAAPAEVVEVGPTVSEFEEFEVVDVFELDGLDGVELHAARPSAAVAPITSAVARGRKQWTGTGRDGSR